MGKLFRRIFGLKEDESFRGMIYVFVYFLIVWIVLSFFVNYLFSQESVYFRFAFWAVLTIPILVFFYILFSTLAYYSIWRAYVFAAIVLAIQFGIIITTIEGFNTVAYLYGLFLEIPMLLFAGAIIRLAGHAFRKTQKKSIRIIIFFIPIVIIILLWGVFAGTCGLGGDTACTAKQAINLRNPELCIDKWREEGGYDAAPVSACLQEYYKQTGDVSVCSIGGIGSREDRIECFRFTTNSVDEFNRAIVDSSYNSAKSILEKSHIDERSKQDYRPVVECYELHSGDVEKTFNCILEQEPGYCYRNWDICFIDTSNI